MSALFTVLAAVMIFIIIVQVAKMLEYVSVIRGKEQGDRRANKLNATLLVLFLVGGLVAVCYCNQVLGPKLLPPAASVQGRAIDHMMWVTGVITGIAFIATEVMLFAFAFFFRERPGRQAQYIPPYSVKNNRLELAWTTVTGVVLLVLVIIGLRQWFRMTGPAPGDARVVEVTGKQFDWIFRYPGPDGELGSKVYTQVDAAASNPLGQEWSDPRNRDDIVETGILHLVVGRPVKLVINAQDVVHDVGLPYFRLKMDAVPGVPTSLWFTPAITTRKMREITGNPRFVYELACDQLCGNGHYAMRATVVVETPAEFDRWVSQQQSQYQIAGRAASDSLAVATAHSGKEPATQKQLVKR